MLGQIHTRFVSALISLIILSALVLIVGCSGTTTFHQYARAGDTVAIATGWREDYSRDQMKVWVKATGWNGDQWTEFGPNNVRAVVKMYPDPISSLVVSNRTGQNITPSALDYGNTLTNGHTGGQLDWSQTVVFFDLPTDLPVGTAQISVENLDGSQAVLSDVQIVGSGGAAHEFSANSIGPLSRQNLAAMERASHYTISMSGSQVPYAVQVDFHHDLGVGTAYVVDPISGMKGMSWHDDGENLRIIIMPANGQTFSNFKKLRFYVAGGVTGLTEVTTTAYDINGDELTANPVSTSVTYRNINIDTTDPA
jgi:hypothetical protein